MKDIEQLNVLPNIDNKLDKLSENLPFQEERLIDICKKANDSELNSQCKNLNNIFTSELEKKWIIFTGALGKLENPIWIN